MMIEPPAEIWSQYAIVAILFFCAGVIALAFWKLWTGLLNWISEQDAKRDAERERQRAWQAEQDKIRDERWQDFLQRFQSEWLKQDGRHIEALDDLTGKVEELIRDLRSHDTWARTNGNGR
ncbi:MAG: hypothetical protein LC130_17085 [Bryobacterales bacterium]|nr:hypothetical protein [Bryobacterales bacterium]